MEKIQDYGYFKPVDIHVKNKLTEGDFDIDLKVDSLQSLPSFPVKELPPHTTVYCTGCIACSNSCTKTKTCK